MIRDSVGPRNALDGIKLPKSRSVAIIYVVSEQTQDYELEEPLGQDPQLILRIVSGCPDLIVTGIAVYRRFDKYNPQAYVELTVRRTSESLRAKTLPRGGPDEPAR